MFLSEFESEEFFTMRNHINVLLSDYALTLTAIYFTFQLLFRSFAMIIKKFYPLDPIFCK